MACVFLKPLPRLDLLRSYAEVVSMTAYTERATRRQAPSGKNVESGVEWRPAAVGNSPLAITPTGMQNVRLPVDSEISKAS